MSRIAVIGTGYVGLTTGAYLAHIGHDVTCADVLEAKIDQLRRGEMPIYEAGLEELVREGLAAGRLRFVVGSGAVDSADFVFLCLPTPQGTDGSADLSYIREEAERIGPLLAPGSVVVNKSTVPVGSTRVVQQALNRGDVVVVSNPEFLREGSAVHDSLHPDRIVIGADDPAAASRVAALFQRISAPVLVTDPASAELIKYASNAFLATRISYINAIANLCEAVGADVREVVLGMGYDKRIGFEFLRPGPGYGGACIPKDTRALVRIAEEAGYDFSLLEGVIKVNDDQHERMVAKIQAALPGGVVDGSTIAAWGLTFKAMTDDFRESPALAVIARLRERGATVRAFDPMVPPARAEGDPRLAGVTVVADPYDACNGADAVALLTEWDELRWLDFDKVRDLLSSPVLVDCRNLLDPAAMRRRGFHYHGVGRP
jgi:UDPglucose 6-dehydrogenase